MPQSRATRAHPMSSPPAPHPPFDGGFTVVGIGASAGGLEACTKLLRALPADNGMAFILVQHLAPAHDSMMVALLAEHTTMVVVQAAGGMRVEPNHLYIIPPGANLSVVDGALHLSPPPAVHGERRPFDFLLRSLAALYGTRAACVILSGTGADGSLGLKAVKEHGGLVIAQDPDEAGYNGMPRNAILTGGVDLVRPAAGIPEALIHHDRSMAIARNANHADAQSPDGDGLAAIIELLRTNTVHDFSLYKRGTLQRRIERRMAMIAIDADGMDRYLEILRTDSGELDMLAKNLLINVTSFFRDPKVFDLLSNTVLPELVRSHPPDRPLRIWIAGCSTGEETYSLTILLIEQITAAKRNIKLQVFASDVDPDAVASAREGLYPEAIVADVSSARLARFFTREEDGYKVTPDVRGSVVFTVQDVLADPPFSRLDLVSCRNLLIYLLPEAQAKVISVFHFALREGGLLVLGHSETVGNGDNRFEVISKVERIYRHVGRSRPGEFGFLMQSGDGVRVRTASPPGQTPLRQVSLADLGRRLVLEAYAPAAVMVNTRYECVYSLGPTERYLRIPAGHATQDLLAMVQPGIRTKLGSAISKAIEGRARITIKGGRTDQDGKPVAFNLDIQPVSTGGEDLVLVCFVDEPKSSRSVEHTAAVSDPPRMAELEHELEVTRAELRGVIRDMEISSEVQKAINEEALSVNEEYQSTNEELLTSKEELQSLNEELTALNSQLQETLDRQRVLSDDLQNVLYSTDVATLFLDRRLNIRFFTPATRLIFNLIPGDIGRPLADLNSLALDDQLSTDAQVVLLSATPLEREIQKPGGATFNRRILPYRSHADEVQGVVITFTDITERKAVRKALQDAIQTAEVANVAKSRFLAAASHDLRQPLQTLTLLQGLLAKLVEGDKAKQLIARFDDTLETMAGMLNTLLDINQIEAGIVRAEIVSFPMNQLLDRLRDEFSYHAKAKGLVLHVVPCTLMIRSDPQLLEQMLRNLLSNAMKYTRHGKILLGCRRRSGLLSVEVLDTGLGVPASELQAIFEEYHQVDNPARERTRGLGLGLSIVRRLGDILGHHVRVRSQRGRGSEFAIEIPLPPQGKSLPIVTPGPVGVAPTDGAAALTGKILLIEDDPDLSELLRDFLIGCGHRVQTASDGPTALALAAGLSVRLDLVLADYNLPNGLNGLETGERLRALFGEDLPIIVLTGDISAETLREVIAWKCMQLTKPIKLSELTTAIQGVLLTAPTSLESAEPHREAHGDHSTVFVVDDNDQVRASICALLEHEGHATCAYPSCEDFLRDYRPGQNQCLLVDAYLPGMSGIELLRRLGTANHRLSTIMITGNSDVSMAVEAMKAGALDFIEKPIGGKELLASIDRALDHSRGAGKLSAWRERAATQVAELTSRQREIMTLVLAGHASKNIAYELGISQRTVENHRAAIMRKTGSDSLPALARLALAAASDGAAPEE